MKTYFSYKILTIVSILNCFLFLVSNAQIRQGEWRDHLPFTNANRIAIADQLVFCGLQTGLLSYNKISGEILKYSKATGLSDVEVTTICYSQTHHKLIVGYKNGNIDFLHSDNTISNLPEIKKKSIPGTKTINRIVIYNDLAYLACNFGIVVVDLIKEEIKDSYLFGEGGTSIHISDLTIRNNQIYAATETGIYYANLNSPNLVDYHYWIRLNFIPEFEMNYKLIETINDKIYAVYNVTESKRDAIIIIEESSYQVLEMEHDSIINDISSTQGFLCISGILRSMIYNNNILYLSFNNYLARHIEIDQDNTIYVASGYSGFNIQVDQDNKRYLVVNGPIYRESNQVETFEDRVWISSGGPQNLYINAAAHSFIDEEWRSYLYPEINSEIPLGNVYKFAIDPLNPDHVYGATVGYGIIEFLNGEVNTILSENNVDVFSDIDENIGMRVAGIQYDNDHNLLILFSLIPQPLYRLTSEGVWEHLEINNNTLSKGMVEYTDLLVTKQGQIWIATKKEGIIVLEDNGAESYNTKGPFAIKNQDSEIIPKINCLEEDNDGNIWVGTISGPLTYFSPERIFEISNILGHQEKIPRNDGTINADFLLFSENITDVKVDGANRIWLATERSGVFLISNRNRKNIDLHFDEENSPLLSNNISGIGVKENNGEVFFASYYGVVSYKGTAIKSYSYFTDVYAYPNPVKPEYEGDITITGLVENTIIKITDLSGNLVFETTSLGGQGIWNGKDFKGNRVASGVYLVFLSSEDGEKTSITKILFIH